MTHDVGFTPVSLTMKDHDQNGKLINVVFGDENEEEMTEEIQEMLFILDSFNIHSQGYHGIAQRYKNLPRLGMRRLLSWKCYPKGKNSVMN